MDKKKENLSLQKKYYLPKRLSENKTQEELIQLKSHFHSSVQQMMKYTRKMRHIYGFFSGSRIDGHSILKARSMCFLYTSTSTHDIYVTCKHSVEGLAINTMNISLVHEYRFLRWKLYEDRSDLSVDKVISSKEDDIAFLFVRCKTNKSFPIFATDTLDFQKEERPYYCMALRHDIDANNGQTLLRFTGIFTDVFSAAKGNLLYSGHISKIYGKLIEGYSLVQNIDMVSYEGCSGSPVIGVSGKIYGMLIGGATSDKRNTNIIPMLVINSRYKQYCKQ